MEYDRALTRRLAAMPAPQQAVFAVACAERMFPCLLPFTRDSQAAPMVRRALDLAWSAMGQVRENPEGARQLAEQCENLLYDAQEDDPFPPPAEDAIAAAVFALLSAVDSDAAGPISTARRGIDLIDAYVQATTVGPQGTESERLFEHPLLREELARRDLDLHALEQSPFEEATTMIRERASGLSLVPADLLAATRWE